MDKSGLPIILEGCDFVGKSTLANILAEKTGYEIVKGSSFEISQLGADGMFEYMMELLDRKNIIIDRFYMSNYVYGDLYDYPRMNNHQFIKLADKAEKNALTVYLTASIHDLEIRMEKRGDEYIKSSSELCMILAKYDECLNDPYTAQKILIYLNTSYIGNMEATASMIKEIAESESTRTLIRNDYETNYEIRN